MKKTKTPISLTIICGLLVPFYTSASQNKEHNNNLLPQIIMLGGAAGLVYYLTKYMFQEDNGHHGPRKPHKKNWENRLWKWRHRWNNNNRYGNNSDSDNDSFFRPKRFPRKHGKQFFRGRGCRNHRWQQHRRKPFRHLRGKGRRFCW